MKEYKYDIGDYVIVAEVVRKREEKSVGRQQALAARFQRAVDCRPIHTLGVERCSKR